MKVNNESIMNPSYEINDKQVRVCSFRFNHKIWLWVRSDQMSYPLNDYHLCFQNLRLFSHFHDALCSIK